MTRKGKDNLFVFFLVVVTLGVALYFLRPKVAVQPVVNEGANVAISTNSGENSNTSEATTYVNKKYAFSFDTNGVSVQETSYGDITTFTFGSDTLSIAPAEQEGIIVNSFGIIKEEAATVVSQKARKILASSAKDGSQFYVVIFTKQDKVYYFQGLEEFIDRVIKSFRFN